MKTEQQIISHMSGSKDMWDWNFRRKECIKAIKLWDGARTFIEVKFREQIQFIPKYLSDIARIIDSSKLIVKTLKT